MPSTYHLTSTRGGKYDPPIRQALKNRIDSLAMGQPISFELPLTPGFQQGSDRVHIEAAYAVFLDRDDHTWVPAASKAAVRQLYYCGSRGSFEVRLSGSTIRITPSAVVPPATSHTPSAPHLPATKEAPTQGPPCAQVHALLLSLQTYTHPTQVAFTDGLYFFYQRAESSAHATTGRIVRIGNHPHSDGALVHRLSQHYSGNKNSSVFRKYLGGALLRARAPSHPCLAPAPGKGHWELQDAKVCPECAPLEHEVSTLLCSQFTFRCVRIDDRAYRNHLERRLIATVASCPLCKPSATWLGLHAYSEHVRSTGLWNSQHVNGPTLTQADLRRFAELVNALATTQKRQ